MAGVTVVCDDGGGGGGSPTTQHLLLPLLLVLAAHHQHLHQQQQVLPQVHCVAAAAGSFAWLQRRRALAPRRQVPAAGLYHMPQPGLHIRIPV